MPSHCLHSLLLPLPLLLLNESGAVPTVQRGINELVARHEVVHKSLKHLTATGLVRLLGLLLVERLLRRPLLGFLGQQLVPLLAFATSILDVLLEVAEVTHAVAQAGVL